MKSLDDLLARQDMLQAEADQVSGDLELTERLDAIGEPVRVGSSALGLMVHPDLDITVVCPKLDATLSETVAQLGATLAVHARIRQVEIRDDTGHWNIDMSYPDGLYLGIEYRSPQQRDWTLDIWFIDEPERIPDLRHLETIPPRLTSETRAAILQIKDDWAHRPEYGTSVYSYDIYQSVLDEKVRTVEQFERWCKQRRTAEHGSQPGH